MGKLEVAFVVAWHGHDGAGAIAHHDVVGDPDGNPRVIDGIDGISAGEDAGLVLVEVAAIHVGLGGARFLIGLDAAVLPGGGDLRQQRVLGGEHHVGRSKQGVRAGGEHFNRGIKLLKLESNGGTLAAADPIFLQQLDAFRPLEGLEFVDEALGVGGDAQHPLAQRAAFDAVAFGFPLFDFFVSQDGAEVRRPPHRGFGDIGQADLIDLLAAPAVGGEFGDRLGPVVLVAEIRPVELEENPLGPAHVLRVGGGDFALPIIGKAERLELAAEGDDIGGGGDGGVLAGLDGVLLGGQAERIVAHRMEDIEALHAFEAPDDIGGGVAFRMPDMETGTTRVGKHVEHVVFRFGRIKPGIAGTGCAEGFVGVPAGLPSGFEIAERKWFAGV